MAFMNEKSTAKLGYQNEFWSNVRNNTNGKKVLVIHDFLTACIMAKNNEVYYITDDEERKNTFVRRVINNKMFGNDDSIELIEDWKNIDKFIEEKFGKDMKFDLIIGNPPYEGNTKLYLRILNTIRKFSDNIIWLCPTLWIDMPIKSFFRHSDIIKETAKNKLTCLAGEGQYFIEQGIDDNIGIFVWLKNKGEIDCLSLWKRHYKNENLLSSIINKFEKINQSIGDDFINVPYNTLLSKVKHKYAVSISSFSSDGDRSPKFKGWAIVEGIKKEGVHWKFNKIISTDGKDKNSTNGSYRGQHDKYMKTFATIEECKNFIDYMNSPICKFAWYLRKVSICISAGAVKYIPMLDFSHKWTDKEICKEIGLTTEEYEYICEEMKPYV